ncbi:hypothetical protein GCM10011505_33150 [Tistrella bauzanensis]|uniref:Phytase-like domain-containing protein n=1 Tax=Tistrella bauzanensis TaxID=657419 RepID=A0ABQ1IQH9_9PROT|nr:esterase-like activity of phytase family protein [Tistrella bauzanensis]GGB49425.1 hypothetical protein GCM10011505_33150 [Tistrella bauzanensis]
MLTRLRGGLLAAMLLLPLTTGCAVPAVYDVADAGGVALLDDRVLRPDDGPRGIPMGGLSEIAADGDGGYVLISDDRGEYGPPRLLTMAIDFDLERRRFRIGARDWLPLVTGAVDGMTPPVTIDGEALRIVPGSGDRLWSSEGRIWDGVPAALYLSDADGTLLRQMVLPDYFRPDKPRGWSGRGMRPNKAFEAIDVTKDGRQAVAMPEDVLMQEMTDENGRTGIPVRVMRFDLDSGRPIGAHVYRLDPFPDPGADGAPGGINANGAVSMLLLDDGRYLVLERAFLKAYGVRIRLYLADPAGADDVLAIDNLKNRRYRAASKRLIGDLIGAGLRADNWEGMAFGPDLPDGRKTLVLVSDDNFNRLFQSTIIAWIALPPLD